MKKVKTIVTLAYMLSALPLLDGCVAGVGYNPREATVGEQLIDLQKAKESGAMTEAEYQAQRANVLGHK